MFETNLYDLFIEQGDLTGIEVGKAVRYDSGSSKYIVSDSDTLENAAIYGFVTRVVSNGFYVKATGLLNNMFTGLDVGERYYLQDSLSHPPQYGTTSGTIEVLMFRAVSETSALIETVREMPSGLGIPVNLTTLISRVDTIEAQVNDESGGILDRLDEHDSDINTINTVSIPTIDTRLDTIEGGTVGIYNLSTITTDISNLDTRLDTAESDIDTVETNVDTLTSDVSTISGNVSTLQSNVSTLQLDVTSLDGRMDTVEDDIGVIEDNVNTIESNIVTINSQITSLQNTGLLPYGYMDGFVFREVTNSTILIGGGACKSQDGDYDIITPYGVSGAPLSIDKNLSGAGGMVGIIPENNVAFVWVISNGINVSACVSPPSYQPGVIPGVMFYNRFRLIGFVHIDGSGNFYPSTDIRLIGRTNVRRTIFGGSNYYNKIGDSLGDSVNFTDIDLTGLIPKFSPTPGGYAGYHVVQVTKLKIGIKVDVDEDDIGASVALVGGDSEAGNNGGGASGIYHSVNMYPLYPGYLNKFESVVDIEGDRLSYKLIGSNSALTMWLLGYEFELGVYYDNEEL